MPETETPRKDTVTLSDMSTSVLPGSPPRPPVAKKLRQIVEGVLIAAGKPLTFEQIQNVFEDGARPSKNDLRKAVVEIAEDCVDRGFELVEVASGWRFQVRQELSQWVGRLWEERPQRYSRAMLETLSLIAYQQPITRGDIEDVRGVAVSSQIMRTLMERGWVRVVGHRDVPGRPAMYATTREFLDYFNIKSLDELPELADIKDLDSSDQQLSLVKADSPSASPSDKVDAEVVDAEVVDTEVLDTEMTDTGTVTAEENEPSLDNNSSAPAALEVAELKAHETDDPDGSNGVMDTRLQKDRQEDQQGDGVASALDDDLDANTEVDEPVVVALSDNDGAADMSSGLAEINQDQSEIDQDQPEKSSIFDYNDSHSLFGSSSPSGQDAPQDDTTPTDEISENRDEEV
jgi:segregation and condensation protein B